MAPAAPPMPQRFPCWCRAVYSWGGEGKHDLGFIEGDLIECLNAGDGSWWTGRLRRDRRMVGSFPSNFVQVLPDDFQPTSRQTSPLAGLNNTPNPAEIKKNKTFRKPFEAYAKAPHYTTAKQPETWKDGVKPRSRENSGASFRQSSNANNSNSFRDSRDSQNDSIRSRGSRNGSVMEQSNRQESFRDSRMRTKSVPENTYDSYRESRSGYAQNSFHNLPNHQARPTAAGVVGPTGAGHVAPPPPPADAGVVALVSGGSRRHYQHHPQKQQQQQQRQQPFPRNSYHGDPTRPAPSSSQYRRRGTSPNPMMDRSPSPNPISYPTDRSPSPMTVRAHSPNPMSHRAHSPNPIYRAHSPSPNMPRSHSPNPMAIHRSHSPNPMSMQRSHSPNPMVSRAHSPNPMMMDRGRSPHPMDDRGPSPHSGRPASPLPPSGYGSRAPSPSPSFRPYRPGAEKPEREPSPPPPPPPAHKYVNRQNSNASYDHLARQNSQVSYDSRIQDNYDLSRHGSMASYDSRNVPEHRGRINSNGSYDARATGGYHTPRSHSPAAPSPAGEGFTPSPLREAMDDVYNALGMSGAPGLEQRQDSPAERLNPWSPESFDMVTHKSKRKRPVRPLTSMGIANVDEGYETYSGSGESSRDNTYHNGGSRGQKNGLPELDSYVDRMETQLKKMHMHNSKVSQEGGAPPAPPPKGVPYDRPKSSMSGSVTSGSQQSNLRARKSAYDVLGRTFTTKTNSTSASSGNQSTTTQSTNKSLMSGTSAGGISATSAGSLARKHQRARSALGMRDLEPERPDSPVSGITYHSSHASQNSQVPPRPPSQAGGGHADDLMMSGLGGLAQPTKKKRGLFGKIRDMAKTGVASGRNTIVAAGSAKASPMSNMSLNKSFTGLSGGSPFRNSVHGNGMMRSETERNLGMGVGREGSGAGGGGGVDWVEVRRDVNRSNTLSRIERSERHDRCQMLDYPAINPVDELFDSIEGDEGADGNPVESPTDYQSINLGNVDKNSRFISGLAPMTNAITLATQYVCRPYRSDVQKLRAIFTWVSEKVVWEEDFEGEIDTRRVVQSKRGCSEEYAVLVAEMCSAVGIHCELVRGYLKTPGEIPETGIMPRSNHWWNCVVVDDEWRILDCCLASPSYPRRNLYSSFSSQHSDPWWFLTKPSEACWTHIPEHATQQHMCPAVAHEILLNLPCACAPYFRNGLDLVDYNTSLCRIEDLEMVHAQFNVPPDTEIAAEVEVRAFSRDSDGDCFESGETVRKRALAQAEWFNGVKRYTVKALLPGDEGTGMLKVYAGKRGLMHSIKDIPHPLAFALPIIHTGDNPPYEFVTRHPTPHAQRHDIYVVQPQCQKLALNNTFVFAVRQHPSNASGIGSAMTPASNPGGDAEVPFLRPGSAMSMTASSSVCGSAVASSAGGAGGKKPAKLAIQTPGGKILRLMRKEEKRTGIAVGGRGVGEEGEVSDGGTWETIIKCSEKGVWRGLVLADRTARWCVFAEWVCVG